MSGESFLPASISNEEHAKLLNALRESEILREFAELLASSLDLKAILEILTKRTIEVCEVERCAVWLVQEDQQHFVSATYHLTAPHLDREAVAKGDRIWPESSFALDCPAMRTLFDGNGVLVVEDLRLETELRHIADQFFVRSMLFVALKRENKPVGVLSLDNPGKKTVFSCAQEQLARAIGQQAAIAISNAHLYREAQTERRRANTLIERVQSIYEVAQSVNSGEDLPTILRIAMEHLVKVLSADDATIAMLQDNKLSIVYSTRFDASTHIAPLHPDIADLPHCYKTALQGVPCFVTKQEAREVEEHWYQQFALHNVLIAPLILGVQRKSSQAAKGIRTIDQHFCIGFAFINYIHRTTAPSRGEYAFACDIAAQCAMAIEKERILTEAQQAAALATERATLLDAVLNAMSEGIIAIDIEGKMVVANATAAKFLGLTPQTKTDLFSVLANHPTYTSHGHPLSLEDFPVSRALKGEHIQSERFLTQRADGRQRTVEVTAVPRYDSKAKQTGVISAFRDVTEQARTDQRIRSALGTLLNAVEAIAGLVETKDILRTVLNITTTAINSERALIQLYDTEQHTLTPVHAIGFTEEAGQTWTQGPAVSTTGSLHPTFRALLEEGHASFIQASDYPYYPDPSDNNLILAVPLTRHNHMFGIMTFDRTPSAVPGMNLPHVAARQAFTVWDLALAEGIAQFTALALQEARWQQEALVARASEMALREANEQKDQFLAITAHEFRSPLTVILANNQMMERTLRRRGSALEGRDIERLQESMKAIDAQTRQLTAIITTFLEVTQLKRGQLSPTLETLDLVELLTRAVTTQQATTTQHSITCHIQSGASPFLIEGDRAHLTQVFVNLLQNAIKYSPLGGPINVFVQQHEDDRRRRVAQIRIKDYGIGVPEQAQARLFECFYRAPNAESNQTPGAGLGLYIVSEFLRLHGGTICVESTGVLGEGSTFICTLPLLEKLPASDKP